MPSSWSASSGYMSIAVGLTHMGTSGSLATVRAQITARSDAYGHSFSSTYRWWGQGGDGSAGFSFLSGWGETKSVLLKEWDFTVPLQYGKTTTAGVGASLGPIWNGGNPTTVCYITLPALAYKKPAAPTSVTAVRKGDSQISLSWAIASTTSAPVLAQGIERYDPAGNAWVRVATVAGSARSWTDTAVPANNVFKYRVWGDSGSNPGQKTETKTWTTSTVAAPTSVTAAKTVNGNIVVSWQRKYPGTGAFTVFDNGVQVGTAAATQSHTEHSWTHTAPSIAQTHTYTVTQTDNGIASPASAASNTVALLVRPNPPKLTAPNGYLAPGKTMLEWVHNPVDSTPQTSAEARYRIVGASTWATVTATTDESAQVTLTQGDFEWQVRTKGLHADWSDWSTIGAFTIEDSPAVGIVAPADGSTLGASKLAVTWTYQQPQGTPQAGAAIQLINAEGALLETRQVSGLSTQTTLSTRIEDDTTYTLRLSAMSGHGLSSETAEATFEVSFPAPATPGVDVVWTEDEGAHLVTVRAGTADAATPETEYLDLDRSVDGGITWEQVAAGLATGTTLVDHEGLSHGTTLYRATAVSAIPSTASTTTEATADSWAMWISGGDGFALAVPLRWDPKHSVAPALVNRKVVHFAGRVLGVELSGRQRQRALSVSATLLDESWDLIQRLEEISYLPAPFLYRDPMGRRVYCSLSGVSMGREISGKWSVQASIEEVDR